MLICGSSIFVKSSMAPAGSWTAWSKSMKRITILLAAAISLLAGAASAEDYTIGAIQVGNPWARATPKGADIAGAYMIVTNKGTEADRLIGGSTSVAGRFEMHRMLMEQGVMKMRPVEGGLEIKAGQTVEFKPGSFHIMLMGLKQPLEKDQRVKATLEFEKAGKVDIEYAVEAMGATGAPAARKGNPAAPKGTMDHGAHTGH
jgi:copper(I)-binding protein